MFAIKSNDSSVVQRQESQDRPQDDTDHITHHLTHQGNLGLGCDLTVAAWDAPLLPDAQPRTTLLRAPLN